MLESIKSGFCGLTLALGLFLPCQNLAAQTAYVSCLVPKGTGCDWIKIALPGGQKEVLANFPCPNYGARVSWKSDLEEAVVWFDPGTYLSVGQSGYGQAKPGYETEEMPDFKSRLYRVDLKDKTLQSIPFPVNPEYGPDEIAYTAKGELAAFDTRGPEPKRKSSDDIDNATARAFHLIKGKWTLFEEKPTTAEECDAVGIDALDSAKNLGPGTVGLLRPHDDGEVVQEKPVLRRLEKFQPKDMARDAGEWRKMTTDYGPIYVLDMSLDVYAFTSGLVVMELNGKMVPLPDEGFTEGDMVGLLIQGPYLLVASSGSGCHPRVYDLRTGELVFKSDAARATVFWPDVK